MPVHRVKGGWRWGNRGKVYRSKAGAERQARAIYAAGWRGDGAAQLTASKRAEARYVRDLRAVLRGLHQAIMAILLPLVPTVAGKRYDGVTRHGMNLDKILMHYVAQVPDKVKPAYDRMAEQVNSTNALANRALLGIRPLEDAKVALQIQAAREANIQLVERAGRDYADDVREVFDDPDNWGLSVDELTEKLTARGNVSDARAELIARDQTLKLNGALTQARQTNAGVESYVWDTSHDDRVRDTHAENDGKTFQWSDPPEETGHPGEDFQCRCVALPVIPELDEIFGAEDDLEE